MFITVILSFFLFQDSEDLFNFVPYPPKEPNAGESSKLNLKRKGGTSSAPQKRQRVQVYSYTKTRAQNISASSRTIKIEIYEGDNQPEKACECSADKCVQYIIKNSCDDIYFALENIIGKIHENMQ